MCIFLRVFTVEKIQYPQNDNDVIDVRRWNHIGDTQHILIYKLLLKRTQISCYDQYRYIMFSLN